MHAPEAPRAYISSMVRTYIRLSSFGIVTQNGQIKMIGWLVGGSINH